MTRALVHRGHVPASAAVLAPALVGLDEARRRVLATWEPGATLNALGDDEWLLRWPCPRRLDAATAPGLLLVLDRGALSAFPLDLPAPGAVIRMRGGATVIEAPGPPLDPAQWLDVSGFSVAEVSIPERVTCRSVLFFASAAQACTAYSSSGSGRYSIVHTISFCGLGRPTTKGAGK